MKRSVGIGLVALLSCAVVGQSQAPPAFDAASIKPSPPDRPPFPYRVGPNSFSMRAILKGFIIQAYDVESGQVIGGPAWAQSESYDIQAKPEGEADTHRIKTMLQTLLADRFQLKLHREIRTMAGYVLSVDKGGPKLPPAKTDMPPDSVGVIQVGGGIRSRGSTIKHLAQGLTVELGQPVIDQTNIQGNYDFRLRFDDDNGDAALQASETGTVAAAPALGSVFTALHEVGLKLESRKIPVEVLVVDSVERPSEN